jgi:hypothetical protein
MSSDGESRNTVIAIFPLTTRRPARLRRVRLQNRTRPPICALTIIELLKKDGPHVSYNGPYFSFIGKGRKYELQVPGNCGHKRV